LAISNFNFGVQPFSPGVGGPFLSGGEEKTSSKGGSLSLFGEETPLFWVTLGARFKFCGSGFWGENPKNKKPNPGVFPTARGGDLVWPRGD